MSEIKAIETRYNGYLFRSRLEARWAVFFDSLGIRYEYEPEGFELPSGKRYLPDFYLKDFEMYAEIKPDTYDDSDNFMYKEFVESKETILLLIKGTPKTPDRDGDRPGGFKSAYNITAFIGSFDSIGRIDDYCDIGFHFNYLGATSLEQYLVRQGIENVPRFDGTFKTFRKIIDIDIENFRKINGNVPHPYFKWGYIVRSLMFYNEYRLTDDIGYRKPCHKVIVALQKASEARFEFSDSEDNKNKTRKEIWGY